MTFYITTNPTAAWITPEKQLGWLKKKIYGEESRLISESAEKLSPVISNIIAEYLIDSKKYTIWYDSLKALNALPEKIPPLPDDIVEKLKGNGSLYPNKKKPDGSACTFGEMHTLMLIPHEFGTLNRFREMIMSYARAQYSKSEETGFTTKNTLKTPNAFYYEYFTQAYSDGAGNVHYNPDYIDRERQREFYNMPFGQTCWELVPKVIPCIDSVFKKTHAVNYETPRLTNAIASIFLYYIATDESIYQIKEGKKWIKINIPVKEKIGGDHVTIKYYYETLKGSAPSVCCIRNINFFQRLVRGNGFPPDLESV